MGFIGQAVDAIAVVALPAFVVLLTLIIIGRLALRRARGRNWWFLARIVEDLGNVTVSPQVGPTQPDREVVAAGAGSRSWP